MSSYKYCIRWLQFALSLYYLHSFVSPYKSRMLMCLIPTGSSCQTHVVQKADNENEERCSAAW